MTNECPKIGCDEETQTAMEDGTCCSLQNARWDWSDPVNVPEYPEECCKGPVTMANECPQIESAVSQYPYLMPGNTDPGVFCEPGYHAPDVPMFGWTVGMACASKCEGGTLTDDHCNCLCVSKADKESEVGLTNENQALKEVNANLLQQIEQAVGDADLALESERALSNTSPEKFTSSALAESSVSQAAKLPAIVTYVFAAIGFLSLLHVGAKHASKALSRGDYAEV